MIPLSFRSIAQTKPLSKVSTSLSGSTVVFVIIQNLTTPKLEYLQMYNFYKLRLCDWLNKYMYLKCGLLSHYVDKGIVPGL